MLTGNPSAPSSFVGVERALLQCSWGGQCPGSMRPRMLGASFPFGEGYEVHGRPAVCESKGHGDLESVFLAQVSM